MLHRYLAIVALFATLAAPVYAQSFVIKKRQKKAGVPTRQLQEQCCCALSDIVKEVPTTLRSLAKQGPIEPETINAIAYLQEQACTELEQFMEDNPQSYIKQGSRQKIEAFEATAHQTHAALKALPGHPDRGRAHAALQLEQLTNQLLT